MPVLGQPDCPLGARVEGYSVSLASVHEQFDLAVRRKVFAQLFKGYARKFAHIVSRDGDYDHAADGACNCQGAVHSFKAYRCGIRRP